MALYDTIGRVNTESAQQIAYFAWAADHANAVPPLQWVHHIPNGGSRGDSAESRKRTGGMLKAQGVRAGVPDVFLPAPSGQWHGLYIEFKAPSQRPKRQGSKGGLSDDQIAFRNYAISVGYGYYVAYDYLEAIAVTKQYLGME